MNKAAKRHLMFCAVLLFIALACTCAFSSVMAHYSVTDTATAFARVEPTNYTVYWLVDFDDNSEYTIVAEGTTTNPATEVNKPADPTKDDTAQYDYEFKQWNKTVEGTVITYIAEFTATLRSYTVTWVVDGASTAETYEYGATPSFKGSTDKAATAKYTYTFTGWSPAVTTVTGAATYTAQYSTTVNKYTVTFKNYDGTVLQTQDVEYDVTPTYTGATPTKPSDHTKHYDYTFSGWSPSVVSVTGNATYTAQFLETEYMAPRYVGYCLDHVRYLNANGDKVSEAFREGYAGGWNTANVFVGSNVAYLQQYGWIAFDAKDKDSFELGYIIDGGEPVYSKDHIGVTESSLLGILQNTMNPAPKCATRFNTYLDIRGLSEGKYNVQFVIKLYGDSGYHTVSQFTLNISSKVTVTYEYKYNVLQYVGQTPAGAQTLTGRHTELVPYGSDAPSYTPPESRTGMKLTGWDNLSNVTSDRTVYAQYSVNSYTNLTVQRKYRFKANFDNIICGSETLSGDSSYNGNSFDTLAFDGKSTGPSHKIILEGWMGFLIGQDELVWSIGTRSEENTVTMPGPWYSCTDGHYHAPSDAVIGAIADVMSGGNYTAANDKNNFRNVEIDLSAYAGQTINIIVAIRKDQTAIVCLSFTNLYVG